MLLVSAGILCSAVAAKCPFARVVVSGEVHGGSPEQQQVQVEVSFNNGPERPTVVFADGKFSATLEFSTYKSFSWLRGDICSRRPLFVTVLLLQSGTYADSVQLDFKRDFAAEESYLYRPRTPVALRADLSTCGPVAVGSQNLGFEDVDFAGYRRAPLLSLLVRPDGSVEKVKIERSSGSRSVDRRILSSVKGWQFNARPRCPVVEMRMDVLVHFR